VKEFLKPANISQSYEQIWRGTFLWLTIFSVFRRKKNMLPAQSKFFKSSQLNRESDRTIIATFEVVIMRRLPLECIRVCA